MNSSLKSHAAIAVLLFTLLLAATPMFADALGTAADAMCNPVIVACPCGTVPGPRGCTGGTNWYNCPGYCKDTTNGIQTSGHCDAPNHCHADTFGAGAGNAGGSTAGGLGSLLQSLGQALGQALIQKLLAPPPPSGGGGGGASTPLTPPSCSISSSIVSSNASGTVIALSWSSSPDVTDASISPAPGVVNPSGSQQLTTNAGTNYTMTVISDGGNATCNSIALGSSGTDLSSLLGTDSSGSLLSALGNTNTNTNIDILSQLQNTPPTAPTPLQVLFASTSGTDTSGLGNQVVTLSGVSGDIQLTNSGATIFTGPQNVGNNTVVAGFFGSDTFGGQQPQGLAAQLCTSRPWAGGFVSSIIPPSFFDGLCSWRGYQVGASQPTTPVVQIQQTAPQTQTSPPLTAPVSGNTNTTVTPSVPASVSIWASPASVPLATRTSIFWNTQGVAQCTETSSDGNFHQNSLSGGAATVPLTGATTFSISCVDSNGNPVTNSVTVNLSI